MIEDKFKKIEIEPEELSSLVSQYLNSCQMAKSTVRSRKFALSAFTQYHKTRKVFYFYPEHINKYRHHLEYKLYLSPLTVRNYLVALNKFFDYLCKENILEKNPAKRIKYKIKKEKRNIINNEAINYENVFVSPNKIKEIIHTPALEIAGKRNKLIFLMSVYSGVSAKFICSLKKIDLVKSERTYYLVGSEAKHPVDTKINFLIKDYLNDTRTHDTEYLFFSTARNSFGKKLAPEFLRNILRNYLNSIDITGPPAKLLRTTSMLLYIDKHKSKKKLIDKFGIKTASVAGKYMDLHTHFK